MLAGRISENVEGPVIASWVISRLNVTAYARVQKQEPGIDISDENSFGEM